MDGLFNVVATVARDTRGWTRNPAPYFERVGEKVQIKSWPPDERGMVWVKHVSCRHRNECHMARTPLDDLDY